MRIELWALAAPYYGGSVTGYVTATIRTNLITGITDTLAGNSSFTNISLNLPYTAPPANKTSRALFLLEYDPVDCSAIDHFCIVDYRNFNETQSPTVPTGLSATATSSSKISLDWAASTDNVGVTTYRVYRNGTLVTLLGNVTSYLDSGLVGSTLNSYAVSACDAAGNCSAQSSTASATTLAPPDTQPPTVPSGLSATVIDSTHINLTWTASTDNVGVTSYKIFSGGSLVSTLGNVTSSFRSNNPSTTYSYTVSACDAADNCSSQSAPVLATTPAALDTQPPTVPTGLTATTVSSSKINLSWNASTDNIGVTAYKINSSDGQTATVGNVTNYSHTGLRSLTEYDYTIVACDAAGNCSLPSASVSSTTTDNPVNGVCGTANGSTFTAIPTANLCSSIGTASTVSGTGPWSWICNGSYGGTSSTCSAMLAVPPVIQFTVTPATGSGYSIFPVIPQVVNNTATTSFTITPASGYGIASVSGCGGSLSGTAYMTGPIIANCTISVIAVARNATSGGTAQAPTIFDALKVLQAVVGVTPLTQTEKIIYDVAPLGDSGSPVGNGIIDAADVILILRRSIGIGEW